MKTQWEHPKTGKKKRCAGGLLYSLVFHYLTCISVSSEFTHKDKAEMYFFLIAASIETPYKSRLALISCCLITQLLKQDIEFSVGLNYALSSVYFVYGSMFQITLYAISWCVPLQPGDWTAASFSLEI